MSKQKPKRPTTRQLKNDITIIVKEILNLKKYVNDGKYVEEKIKLPEFNRTAYIRLYTKKGKKIEINLKYNK